MFNIQVAFETALLCADVFGVEGDHIVGNRDPFRLTESGAVLRTYTDNPFVWTLCVKSQMR